MAEHRLERVVQAADQIIDVSGDGSGAVRDGSPATMLAGDARRRAPQLRERLAEAAPPASELPPG